MVCTTVQHRSAPGTTGKLTAIPFSARLEWYVARLWLCADLYDRDDPSVVGCDELLGVVGAPFPVVRVVRAVRGVGALIRDFLGVSITCLTRLPASVDDERVAFGVVDAGGTLGRFSAVTNGCLRAAWGLIRRSGSQTRHFAIKSTNSSSLHLRTWASVFVPGLLRRPLELITARGAPLGSAN